MTSSERDPVADPPELLRVQAHAQRLQAAQSALEACETDLTRVTAEALAAGLSTEHVCDRLAELGFAVDQLPRALRATLGYRGARPDGDPS